MKDVLRARLLLITFAVIVLGIDQLSKAWFANHIAEYSTVEITPWLQPILSLTPIRNTGGVFGLLPGLGTIFQYLSLIIVVIILFYQRAVPAHQTWIHIALGLVSGGALGNVIDRFTRGYVLDFIDVNFWPLARYPIFNGADSAIVIGVFILLIDALFSPQDGVFSHAQQ